MENSDYYTKQNFIQKMIEILIALNKFDALKNNPNLEKDIKKQIDLIEKQKKEEKNKSQNNMIIKEFDFYEVAIQNIIESAGDLKLFFQNKIIIQICEKCKIKKIKTEDTNVLSSFNTSIRYGNEYNLEEFFAINKVKINCHKCKAKDSVKAETIFSRIPEYLIILFKKNIKKIIYPDKSFSFEYIDVKNVQNFSYKNSKCLYNLKALMIKENSDFNYIMIKNKRDFDKYKNNPKLNIPLVLIYHKESENLEGNNLKQDGTIINELKNFYKNNPNINNNNNNSINNQNIIYNNNIQNLNQTTKIFIDPIINNNQNNNNNNINNKMISNNNNFYNNQGNNNQINMINNNQYSNNQNYPINAMYNNNFNNMNNINMNNNMYNNMNNNMNNNNMNMNNNMNNNVINNNFNQNNIIQNQNQNNINYNIDGIVCLIFTFPAYKKDIYIDIGENETFNKVIEELKEKYMWLNKLKDLKFVYNNKEINGNKTVKENGLNDSNKIVIQFRDE